MSQDFVLQFGEEPSVFLGFSISLVDGLLPMTEGLRRLLVIGTNRSELRVARKAAPNVKFALRKPGYYRSNSLHAIYQRPVEGLTLDINVTAPIA